MKNRKISERDCRFIVALLYLYCDVSDVLTKTELLNELQCIGDTIYEDSCIDWDRFDVIVDSLKNRENLNKLLKFVNDRV